jgi:hypothetical protein
LHFLRLHLESLRHSINGIILPLHRLVVRRCRHLEVSSTSILRGERDRRIVDSEQELKSSFTVLEDVAILRLHPDSAIVFGVFVCVYAREVPFLSTKDLVYLSFYLTSKVRRISAVQFLMASHGSAKPQSTEETKRILRFLPFSF